MSVTDEELRMLGASDAPALFTQAGLVALYHRVTTGERSEATPEMAMGTDVEPVIRGWYARHTGWEVSGERKWRHPLVPWMRASPDATVRTSDGQHGAEWKYWRSFPSEVGGVPESVWIQVQVLMGVGLEVLGEWDSPWMDVVNGHGGLDVRRVPYQPGVLERFEQLGERFMVDFVRRGEPPQGPNLVLLERDAAAVKALYPCETTAERRAWDTLDEHLQGVVHGWLEANAARKEWEGREEALATRVRLALADAPGLDLPEGLDARRIDWKAQGGQQRFDRKGFEAALAGEDPALVLRVRELLKQYTTETTTRPLVAR